MKTKAETKADCKRLAYLYGIELSGLDKNGIAIAHEGYATAFETWHQVYRVLYAWREGKSFRDACLSVS